MAGFRTSLPPIFVILVAGLSIAVLVPVLVLGYWAFDRRYPLNNLSGHFDRWDEADPQIALITWKADRDRLCPGRSYRWIIADHPHQLKGGILPPPGASDQIGGRGVLFTTRVPVPPEALQTDKSTVTYHVRLVWECNPLQRYWPLILEPPEITIPVPPRLQ